MAIKRYLVTFMVLSLLLLLMPAYGIANAKSPKPQDQVKNFMSAAAGLKAFKAASYCVTEEHSNVSSQLAKVPSGAKISLSKLKLSVTSQTADTAEVTAAYTVKIKLKGQKNTLQSNLTDTFNLKMVNGSWLIAGTTMWEHLLAKLGTTSTPTATATAQPTATSAVKTATPSPTTSGNPVKIGAIQPWSGPASIAGMFYADPAIKLVEKQVSDMGGILGGRPLKVVKYDNRNTVADSVSGAKKLILEDKVSALVFGGTTAAQCTAVSDTAAESEVLFVSVAPLDNTPERKFTVEATMPRRCIVDDVVKLTNEVLKPKTVAILGRTDEYTLGTVIPGWKKGVEAAGINVVYSEATDIGVQDFMPYLTKIKHLDPDVLLLLQSSEESMAIAKQIMELGGWGHTQVVAQTNSLAAAKMPGANGWLIMVLWHPDLDTPDSVKFKNDFQAVNGKVPEPNHAFYYLSLWTAIHAIELAGNAEDTEAIARAARSGNLEFDTPLGHAHFTTEGDSGLSGMFVQVQTGGKTVPFKNQ